MSLDVFNNIIPYS